jgi:hypothetical protein
MRADALTKIVMLRGEKSFSLLEKFSAAALLITTSGEILNVSTTTYAGHLP